MSAKDGGMQGGSGEEVAAADTREPAEAGAKKKGSLSADVDALILRADAVIKPPQKQSPFVRNASKGPGWIGTAR